MLACWQHHDLGLVLPENFIHLAEENDLIGCFTRQIVRRAFMSAPVSPEPLVLASNFSGEIVRWHGCVEDTEERKDLEKEFRKSRNRT